MDGTQSRHIHLYSLSFLVQKPPYRNITRTLIPIRQVPPLVLLIMAELPSLIRTLQPLSLAEKFDAKLLISVIILSCFTYAAYNYLLHPLRHVPGPFPAKITELWRTRRYMLGNWHQDILDLHNRYGPIVRISPNEVSIVDKNALVSVFGHGKGTRKVSFMSIIRLVPMLERITNVVQTSWYDVWKIPGVSNSVSRINELESQTDANHYISSLTQPILSNIHSFESEFRPCTACRTFYLTNRRLST